MRLDRDSVRAQTFDFYKTVVIPAFITLNRAFRDVNDLALIARAQGWLPVRMYHATRQHYISYAIRVQLMGMKLRVQSNISIRDPLGTYTKTHILFGCTHKALEDISQDDIVQGFIKMYERMLSSED